MKNIIENDLIVVVSETSVQQNVQLMLIERFTPFLNQAKEWKEKAESLVITDINQTREMKMAREARLALREIRINADKVRKELKEDSLNYGRAVQGVYNVIEAAILPIESHLENQEKFKELYELEKREKLRIEREIIIKDVREYIISNLNLGIISEEDFQKIYKGAILQKQDAEEAAMKAEADRIAKEKAEAEERERLQIENERLRIEAIEKENERKAELKRLEAKMQAERDKLIDEQKRLNIEAAKARKEAEKKAEDERKQAQLIAAELQAKKDAEINNEIARQAAIEAELSKGDKDKIEDLKKELEKLKTKFEFSSKKYKNLYLNVVVLLEKIIVFIG